MNHKAESSHAITAVPLLIVVGVTGVGKTTTVNALRDAGLSFTILPNRRTLTDQLIIAEMQRDQGMAVEPITDRTERFALTKQYRQKYDGGMAHALAQLSVDQTDEAWYLFDGLRGENEVAHAVTALPLAHFLMLDAPHAVRVQRLLGRNDAFDQIASAQTEKPNGRSLNELVANVCMLFTEEEQQQLWALVQTGVVTPADMQAKLTIVAKEAENYDPAATIHALQQMAPQRTTLIDTTQIQPADIAKIVMADMR